MKNRLMYIFITLFFTGCASVPPRDVNNICSIFKEHPSWHADARDVEKRWRVPIPVQMAIIHQESKFDANAQPARQKLLKVIPWKRPSTAYGYTQALKTTWFLYKKQHGNIFSSRDDFGDAVNFIGWYANDAHKRAKISRDDPYALYLAYHEGVGGFLRKTYLDKTWLVQVARKVKSRSQLYDMQLKSCMR